VIGNKRTGVMGYTSRQYVLEDCKPYGRDYSLCDGNSLAGSQRAREPVGINNAGAGGVFGSGVCDREKGSRKSIIVFFNDSRHSVSKNRTGIPASRPPRHYTPSFLDSNDATFITAGRGGFMLRPGAQPGTSSSSNRNSALSPRLGSAWYPAAGKGS
jgi:hypothetical protein